MAEKDILSISGRTILECKEPSQLFSNNATLIKKEYRQLSKKWHPDSYPDKELATKVITALNILYEKGLEQIEKGIWEVPNTLIFKTVEGKQITFKYKVCEPFELGMVYHTTNFVAYLLDGCYENLKSNAESKLSKIKYANEEMKKEFERYLPTFKKAVKTQDGRWFILIPKTKDIITLSQLMKYLKVTESANKLNPRHVCWVLSRLLNLLCFLEYNNISYNGLTLDTIYVSPEYHSLLLLGGWWYATDIGEKLKAMPSKVANNISPKMFLDKLGKSQIDVESMRYIARLLLGDPVGPELAKDPDIPKVLSDWVRKTEDKEATHLFKDWSKVLTSAYGARKFVKLEVDYDKVYEYCK